jgi:WD40 repeat protein
LWNLEWDTGPLLIRGRPQQFNAMAASADGNTLLTGNQADGVHLWDVATGSELGRLSPERGLSFESGVGRVAMTPDGKRALVASKNGRIAVYDLQTMLEEPLLCVHPSVRSLAVSSDGNRVVVADGGNVDVWDLARRQLIFTTKSPSTLIGGTGFSADDRTIVGCSSHGEAMYWDVATGLRMPGLDLLPRRRELRYDSSAVYTRGLSAMFGVTGPVVRVWTPLSGRDIARLYGHTGTVNALDISKDQCWIASGGADRTVRLWDLSTLSEVQCFRGHETSVNCVAFSADGSRLFSSASDRWIRVWDFTVPQKFLDFTHRLDQARAELRQTPDDPVGLASLGEWYAFRGIDDWAAELLELARAKGANVSPLLLGRVYWRLDRPEKAAAELERAIQSPEAPLNYLRQCLAALRPTPSRAR